MNKQYTLIFEDFFILCLSYSFILSKRLHHRSTDVTEVNELMRRLTKVFDATRIHVKIKPNSSGKNKMI